MKRCLNEGCEWPDKRACPATTKCPAFVEAIHVWVKDECGRPLTIGLTYDEAVRLQIELHEEIDSFLRRQRAQQETADEERED